MKRRVVLILLLLVAGAIVNVAVAYVAEHRERFQPVIEFAIGGPLREFTVRTFRAEVDERDNLVWSWFGTPCAVIGYAYRTDRYPTVTGVRAVLWPGFAINTVFYAVILWGLFAAPFALRRRRRIKRGLCPKCAYPVGTWGGAVCTECGCAVSRLD